MFAWLPARWPWQRPSLGARGEAAAARYLRRLGYKIVAQGDRGPLGEIDIVAVDRRTVVFVEVKTRASIDHGLPAEAVNDAKQRRLTRLALGYLKRHGLLDYPSRFDVVSIVWSDDKRPEITHIQSAFDAVGLKGMHS